MGFRRRSFPRWVCFMSSLLLLLFMCQTSADWFRVRGPTIIGTTFTVGGNYHLVTVSDAVFTGAGAGLVIEVGAMALTQGAGKTLTIQLCSCKLLNGASIVFKGNSSLLTAPSASMSLIILSLSVTNAGVAFTGEMPYGSRVSLGQPAFYMDRGACTNFPTSVVGTFTSSSAGCYVAILFSSANFRAGSFLLYGQLPNINANTFEGLSGGAIGDVVFSGSSGAFNGCMFHIFQLASVHGYPMTSVPGASFTVSGSSVFYIQQMITTACTVCIRIDNIYLRSKGVFLLDSGQLNGGGYGFQFNGNGDATAWWFGIMGNTFNLNGGAITGPGSGSSSFSGASPGYMSVFGNFYIGSWSQYASPCYDMCTSLNGVLQASFIGGSSSSSCVPSTLCSNQAAQCFSSFGSLQCIDQRPTCVCVGSGVTAYCIPFFAPKIPTACVSTLSDTVSDPITMTWTETSSHSITEDPSSSKTQTGEMSVTKSRSPSFTGPSTTKEVSASPTESQQVSESPTLSLHSITHNQSMSVYVSPTHFTYSLSRSASPTGDRSPSGLTHSLSIVQTNSKSPSPTPTQRLTPTATWSSTVTMSATPSKSKNTASLTWSWCEWRELGLTAVPPLVRNMQVNDTFDVNYLEFRDNGASFIFDDLGQWYVVDWSWIGDPASNVTTFNLTEIKPHTYPVVLGMWAHGFPPDLFYNSELSRSVTIAVVFRCAVVNYTQYWVINVLPLHAPLSAATTQTLIRSAMLASVALATPYGSAIAALALNLQQLYLCQPLTETDQYDVTRWRIGEDNMSMMRGAIVGNFLVTVGQFVVMMCVLGIAVRWNQRIGDITMQEDFWRVLRVMQLPTSLHITVSAMLQLIVAASVSLFRMSSDARDLVLGVFGMLFGAAYTILVCYRAVRIYMDRRGTFGLRSLSLPIRILPKEEDEFLYGEYDKPWYAGFETMFFLTIGIISGTPPAHPYDCTIQFFAVAFISGVSIVILLAFRPMRTLFGQFAAIFIRVFTIVLCGCAYTMTRSRPDQVRAMQGACVCLILLAIFAMMRALYDLKRAYYGVPPLFRAIFRLKLPEPIPMPDSMPEPDLDEFPEAEEICPSSSSSDDEFVAQDRLKETDVIGFLGQTKDEVETDDDLLMAYRKKKKQHPDKEINLEKLLQGDIGGDDTEEDESSAPPATNDEEDSDEEEDVRRVVKKGPIVFDGKDSDSDDDDEAIAKKKQQHVNPFAEFSPAGNQADAAELRSTSDKSLFSKSTDEEDDI